MSTNPSEKKSGCTAESSSVGANDLSENLRRLDRLANLGLVSANIAHEIKNGLVAIKTYVELLLEKGDDTEMAEVVRRELTRIDGLATAMLRLAAPKSSTLTKVPVHQVLDHSLRLLEHQMSGRMIELRREYGATPDTVHGDESQLQQAFMNLVLNGIEAIGHNGELTVRTEIFTNATGCSGLKIYFSDTGPGIAAENLSRLFEPFFTTKKNGTGLGLAISQRVAEDHQGNIQVVSEVGSGSTFIISLPAE
ncbi:MAG TPA: ATP-binding protein [Verrucomicrobiae bacterium]